MSRSLRIFRVDAFTTVPCAGNPAAVVLGADLLEERQLQSITRELGGVDAAFVLPADGTDHDLRLRFFTPRGETGLVGHATLAVHAVLDALGQPVCHRQKQRGGYVNIERLRGPEGTRYAFSQAPPPIQGPLASDRLALVLRALGLDEGELDTDCPPVVAGAGGSRALIALRSGAALARLQPDLSLLAGLSAAGGPAGFFVYSLNPSVPDCDSEARMFCPALGIPEDPVSGNAHAMLASHLQSLGRMPDRGGSLELIGRQGHHLGRPGVVSVHIQTGAAPHPVRVAGNARVIFEAVLHI